jgi:probable HAF family extracellular repeat protein
MKDMNCTSGFRPCRNRSLLLALLAPLLLSPLRATAGQPVDLGIAVSPADINNNGTIVGSRTTVTGTVAFHLPSGGTLQDIPGATHATAINDIGQITGNTPDGAFLLNGSLRKWAGYGGYGINEYGQVSGNRQLDNPYRSSPLPLDPAVYTPDRWDNPGIAGVYSRGTRQGVYADLYVLDDINEAGFAVGKRSRYGLAGSSSIVATPSLDVIYLPVPYGGRATAINNQNLVVGATGTNSTSGEFAHAYLYDYNAGSLLDLGTLNGGLGLTSSAADINDFNQVVGTSWMVTQLTSVYDPAQYHAFLWQDGVMSDLNDTLPAGSGWILTAATAINDHGDIVGTGLLNGEMHGFLLSNDQGPPPPPADGQPPVAVAGADVTSGRASLTVHFSSSGSYDPDGPLAAVVWDFGDNSPVSTEANPVHVYTEPGNYSAELTVIDGAGLSASTAVDIQVRKAKGGGKL